ncbi:MAG: DUF2069 domain-containing protein [Burkholderiales bacterium]|nr:DUF2069 domain-containing protein [Burkholderiales bacterium]
MTEALRRAALASLVALVALCLAWELWLAPLRPGGSWIALKALPLVPVLRGVLAGRRYTFQWSSMLILAYLAEGVTRALSERGPVRLLAAAEIALSLAYLGAALAYVRITRTNAAPRDPAP